MAAFLVSCVLVARFALSSRTLQMIGAHLRDALKIPVEQPLAVIVEGAAESEERGRRASAMLREAGYSRITRVGFLSEPGQ